MGHKYATLKFAVFPYIFMALMVATYLRDILKNQNFK